MATFFLCMIYAAFISLGLPDSLLGAAWPAMQPALGVPLDSAGVLSMIVAGGTVVASLSADRMLHRFGTGRVTLVSVTMTACALLGYALAPGFWWLALAAVPMGLGAGAVDAGLNNFVALHYEARHMSWLHCFWGVGATLGPVILSLFLGGKHGWRGGYGAVCAIQFCLVAVLAVTLPMWDRYEDRAALRAEAAAAKQAGKKQSTLNIPGVKGALATFFFYCACLLYTSATAAVSGILLFGALRFCQRLRLNGILQSMLASALAALAVMLMVEMCIRDRVQAGAQRNARDQRLAKVVGHVQDPAPPWKNLPACAACTKNRGCTVRAPPSAPL